MANKKYEQLKIKTILTILFCSLLFSCANLGEEYVTIRLPHPEKIKVVRISEVEWSESENGWRTDGWCIMSLEDYEKVDTYMNQ